MAAVFGVTVLIWLAWAGYTGKQVNPNPMIKRVKFRLNAIVPTLLNCDSDDFSG
ncbi:hypothetical protein N44_01635 [Microcystis aeruginosa NIES-44]|uniref:Uncharacterized protein n=1 Tax=Microcystis aeruginosa NIES-44 TaxID=449439 RepID=A0A0A1VU36_MICAE|nr:hypothetical protein N44_01635 [Microcystis aeruginosa NIES-44]